MNLRWARILAALLIFALDADATVTIFPTASQPSSPPSKGVSCGSPSTQVTICFPGDTAAAECEYAVTNSSTAGVKTEPCPTEPLFGHDCDVLEGLLLVAFGPCQNTIAVRTLANPFAEAPVGALEKEVDSNSILGWLDLLGLQTISQIGGFVVRGYAYQLGPLPSTDGIGLLPSLTKVGNVTLATSASITSSLTVLGAAVPQLDLVSDLAGGLLIENTPNTNFSGLFTSVQNIKGVIGIVGNSQLTSLDGLQGLTTAEVLSNLEILSNPRLTDIDALGSAFLCNANGTTGVTPSFALIGIVEVTPSRPTSTETRCLLTRAVDVCDFIATTICPDGTASTSRSSIEDLAALVPSPGK